MEQSSSSPVRIEVRPIFDEQMEDFGFGAVYVTGSHVLAVLEIYGQEIPGAEEIFYGLAETLPADIVDFVRVWRQFAEQNGFEFTIDQRIADKIKGYEEE